MSVLVDTSVWSLALRRDAPVDAPAVDKLRRAIEQGEAVLIGSVLQELLQGFRDATRTRRLANDLAQFPLLALGRGDYVLAAHVRNTCRSKGVQIGTIDAQIAAAALNHRCAVLTTDADFEHVARHFPLKIA